MGKSKIASASKSFEPCPEFTGRCVCVDVTEPFINEHYGGKETVRLVFETDQEKEDSKDAGARWCVWSRPMTLTLGDKSNLRKFLTQWFGRQLTTEEVASFDLETLVGRAGEIAIIHEASEEADGKVFDKIAYLKPAKEKPLKPSGVYVRLEDRKKEDRDDRDRGDGGGGGGRTGSSARKTEGAGPAKDGKAPTLGDAFNNPGRIKIHLGNHKGLELGEISREDVGKLIENWLDRTYKAMKPGDIRQADRILAAALERKRELFAEEEASGGGAEAAERTDY